MLGISMCLCHVDNAKVGIIFESANAFQKKIQKKNYIIKKVKIKGVLVFFNEKYLQKSKIFIILSHRKNGQ